VQWGTVRMLGTLLAEDPTAVPTSVVWFVAEQLGVDAERFAEYGRARRRSTSTRGRSVTSTATEISRRARRSFGRFWRARELSVLGKEGASFGLGPATSPSLVVREQLSEQAGQGLPVLGWKRSE
jgi:Domain of unknown function (DUF4158)